MLGILQRDCVVHAFPVSGRGRAELERLIVAHTLPGSLYYTDDWQAYASLAVRGSHIVFRKERGRAKGATTSTASKAFGVTPSIGCICIAEYRKSFSIFIWVKSSSGLIIVMKIYAR